MRKLAYPRLLGFAALVCGAAQLVACGDDSGGTAPDASVPDATVDATLDADASPPDADLEESYLYGPCVADIQCPNFGTCITAAMGGGPGGVCSAMCESRAPCDDGINFNECRDDGMCVKTCVNGADCGRQGYTCDESTTPGQCIGVCSTDEECGPGAVCNVFSGECAPAGTAFSGSPTGGACADNDGCQGGPCNPEFIGGNPTGWNGGYCLGPCILPVGYNTNNFYNGQLLPQGTCASGDICFPEGSFTQRDLGLCLDGCAQDSDCREEDAYYCRKSFAVTSGNQTFANGVCWPLDCGSEMCPTGFTCVQIPIGGGRVRNTCRRM